MASRPSFQFYPADWLSSRKVALMTPAQEGAYIRLLCYCWDDPDCTLPDDDAQLAVLSRLGEGWFDGGSDAVLWCFEAHPSINGRLTNGRLMAEREKQDAWREKSAEGGRKSGKARRLQSKKGGSRVVEPKGNSSTPSSSATSTPSDKTPPKPPKGAVAFEPEFLQWWDGYPKKTGKAAARKAWGKAVVAVGPLKLIEALGAQLPAMLAKESKYRPNPATWLNEGRWEDETPSEPLVRPDGPRDKAREALQAVVDIKAARARGENPGGFLNG